MDTNGNRNAPEKPEKNIRCGAIRAGIWSRNVRRKDGTAFQSKRVIIDRSYRDASGNWRNTSALDFNDIPKAILALQRAYEWILTGGSDSREEIAEEDIVF